MIGRACVPNAPFVYIKFTYCGLKNADYCDKIELTDMNHGKETVS